ncbi:hypothetical protein OPV22_024548 [Ensete ventricosum]|uniref:Uncharacterized protein n=1 Tax=Ensete ventricosum TaxID=4639 RepID=A0AAV8P7H2_ENSVE|nr:hypothetical protein OPV22_024548 [Ensete ventricosum]
MAPNPSSPSSSTSTRNAACPLAATLQEELAAAEPPFLPLFPPRSNRCCPRPGRRRRQEGGALSGGRGHLDLALLRLPVRRQAAERVAPTALVQAEDALVRAGSRHKEDEQLEVETKGLHPDHEAILVDEPPKAVYFGPSNKDCHVALQG